MKKYYLVFEKSEGNKFIGFTSINPPVYALKNFIYNEVSKEDYKIKIQSFENGDKIVM